MAGKSGMEMLLGSLGIEPKKIMEDFKALQEGVTNLLKNIDTRLNQAAEERKEILTWIRAQQNQQPQRQQHLALVPAQPNPQPIPQPQPQPSQAAQQ